MNEGNIFLLSWDIQGLEAVVNITDLDKEATWATLQDKPGPRLSSVVNAVMFRARYNSQRHYEVYTVTMSKDITEQDIRDMFERNGQAMADLIRKRGHCMYTDCIYQEDVKIS